MSEYRIPKVTKKWRHHPASLVNEFVLAAGIVAITTLSVIAEDYRSRSFYLYLGNDPRDVERDWTDAAHGITHDDTHWYITQGETIWRVPVRVDLGSFDRNTPGVTRVRMQDIDGIAPYDQAGDPAYYKYGGTGYLVVPFEKDNYVPIFAIFEAETLEFIDAQGYVPDDPLKWCAFTDEGLLFTVNLSGVPEISVLEIRWDVLRDSGTLQLIVRDSINLLDADGHDRHFGGIVGGAFSDDGSRLYLMKDSAVVQSGGIHVFDTSTWRLLRKSESGQDPFNFQYNPEFPDYDERPRGLTIWNLDEQPSPHHGQLHAILLNRDSLSDDNVWVKHYTDTILVDADGAGEQKGTLDHPFRTVGGAVDLAWDESRIKVRAASYPESVLVTKCVRLEAEGGLVRIGG